MLLLLVYINYWKVSFHLFKDVKTSYDLHVENVKLILQEKIGELFLRKKELETEISLVKADIVNYQQELFDEMRENNIQEATLNDEFNVQYAPQVVTKRVLPLKELITVLLNVFDIGMSRDELEEYITKESTRREHIKIVKNKNM